MRARRTRLPLLTVVVVTLTALLATLAPSAQAAPVRGRDLVSRADVLKVFPALEHEYMSREGGRNALRHPTPEGCSEIEAQGTSGRVVSTPWGLYDQKRWFRAHLVQFASARQAKRVVATVKRFVRACAQQPSTGTRVRPAKLPRLGDQRVAYRQVVRWSRYTQRTTTVVVRKGKRVLLMDIKMPKTIPARQIARISRIAVARMS